MAAAADDAGDDWSNVAADMLASSEKDSEEQSDADAIRSETCTEWAEPSQSPSQTSKTSSWWARMIKEHTKEQAAEAHQHEPTNKKFVVSGCSGAFAEGEVLKAGSISSAIIKRVNLQDLALNLNVAATFRFSAKTRKFN